MIVSLGLLVGPARLRRSGKRRAQPRVYCTKGSIFSLQNFQVLCKNKWILPYPSKKIMGERPKRQQSDSTIRYRKPMFASNSVRRLWIERNSVIVVQFDVKIENDSRTLLNAFDTWTKTPKVIRPVNSPAPMIR